MRGGRVGRHAEADRQRTARRVDLAGLQVGEAEEVVQFDVVRRPRARGLEVRQRLGQAAGAIEREAEHLLRLTTLETSGLEPRHDRRQHVDRLRVIVGVVEGEAAQVDDERIRGIEGVQLLLRRGRLS